MPQTRFKFSSVESRLNIFLMFYFIWLVIVCTVSTLFEAEWEYKARRFWPLFLNAKVGRSTLFLTGDIAKQWLSFMLLYKLVAPWAVASGCSLAPSLGRCATAG
jgi:hypothetical protein